MRASPELYHQAMDAAWQKIQSRLEAIKKMLNIRDVELVELTYDGDSSVSLVDELPDEPKSSSPDHIEVRVTVEACYRIVRQP
ncbi:MAG TPA: hypothetical protein VE398_12625 [Acidobacteriota bacterium]|nr:hypothetical protein [Acidobacteriota bacterium]